MTLLLKIMGGTAGGLQERAGDGELAAAPRRLYSNSIWNCMEFHMEGFLNFRMEEFQKNLRMEYGIWKFHMTLQRIS
jgi:hypothetical protein